MADVQQQLTALPALRGLARLADVRPVVVIDTREQVPLAFHRLESVSGTLQSGDYSIAGLEHQFAVERKTIADFVGCCTGESRDRFERELHRLRGFRFARLLVIGAEDDILQHRYRSNIASKAVWHTLRAFEVRYVPVVWALNAGRAAELIETWAYWFAREIVCAANDLLRGTGQGNWNIK